MTTEPPPDPSICRCCGNPRRRRANQPNCFKGANGYCEACNNRWHAAGCPPEGPPPPMTHAERTARAVQAMREAKEPAIMNRSLTAQLATLSERGACRGTDVTVFFGPDGERQPEREIRERQAKALCASCPVRGECLGYAVSRPEKYGTWGGLNEDERAAERRRRLRKGELAA